MKKLILLLIILIMLPIVSADYVTVHDSWHTYKDSFTIKGTLYEVSLNDDKVLLKADGAATLLIINKCETVLGYQYCFNETNEDRAEARITKDGKVAPAIRIIIKEFNSQISSSIKLEHEYDLAEGTLKENLLTVKIQNDGEEWITGAKYLLTIPTNIEITDVKEFFLKGDLLEKTISLSPGQELELKFKYKPKDYGTHKFNYTLSYVTQAGEEELKNNFDISIKKPYKLTTSFPSSEVSINDVVTLELNLLNQNEEDVLKIKELKIVGPKIFLYNPTKNLKQTAIGEHEGTVNSITSNKSETFKLNMYPQREGNFTILIESIFEIENKLLTNTTILNLKSSAKGIEDLLSLDKTFVVPGENVELMYQVSNTAAKLEFKELILEIKSPLLNKTFEIGYLPMLEKEVLKVATIKAPFVDKDVKYDFESELTYKTQYNQELKTKNKITLNVEGSGDLLNIQKSVNSTNLKLGDEVLVYLTVDNLLDQDYELVFFQEDVPSEVNLIAGEIKNEFALFRKESKKPYSYKFKIPNDFKKSKFDINTSIKIPDLGFEKIIQTKFNVDLPMQVVVNEPEEESKEIIDVVVNAPIKDKGFFEKLIDSIEDFFSSIF